MSGEKDKITGRVKQAAGDLADDDDLKREGERDEAAGKVKDKVGDAKDKRTFKGSDVQSIIASTGAFVGVIPFRDGVATASATDNPYKYFLRELDTAAAKGVPSVVIADPRIHRTDGDDSAWLRMETDADTFVTGSTIFGSKDDAATIRDMRARLS